MDIGKIRPVILESLRAQPLNWHMALSELCDNSFDAGAARVEIKFYTDNKKKIVRIKDDGAGCDNVERMLTLGEHYRMETTKLGRFGVGLKEAACWLWGELHVETVCKGIKRMAYVDWERLKHQDSWNVPDPTDWPAENGEVGTELSIRSYTRGMPDHKALLNELSYTFAPALWAGKQIVLKFPRKSYTCAGWKLPDMEDIIQDRFEIAGKRVRLQAGIVAIGAVNSRQGFSICHGHRIIVNSGFGSKDMSVARICGIIELDSAWRLSKNKTEIVDDNNAELQQAIFDRCRHILEKAAQQTKLLRNSALEQRVTESLRALLLSQKKEKAKRASPANPTGAVKPTGKGGRHKRAAHTQPGERFLSKCDIGSMRMEWESRTDNSIGRIDIPGHAIYLNDTHKRLQRHRETENDDALVDICMALLSYEAVESDQRAILPGLRDYGGFISTWSNVLQSQQVTDEAIKSAK